MSGKVLKYTRTVFVGALLAAATLPALASPADPGPTQGMGPGQGMGPRNGTNPDMREMVRENIQARMDRLAARLELKASQQAVWKDFVQTVMQVTEIKLKHPGPNATAAEVAHFRARKAKKLAEVLERIARKTDKLEAALTKEQRAVLDNAFRNYSGRHPGGMHGRRGQGMGPGGQGMGPGGQGMGPGGMNGNPGAPQR